MTRFATLVRALAGASIALLLALTLAPLPALAQDEGDPCAGGFPGASAAYALSYERDEQLASTRGFSFRNVGMAALDDILGSGGRRTAVAMFADAGEKHCVYILTGRRISAFAVSEGKGPARERIARLLEEWRKAAGVQDGPVRGLRATLLAGAKPAARKPEASPAAQLAAGERLAGALFPGDTRAALEGITRLVILPYAGLGAVPFAALPLDESGTLFVDRLAISISPGPRFFGTDRPTASFDGATACTRGAGQVPALVVGDPVAPPRGTAVFPALPGARREAIDAAKRFGVTPLLGADAVQDAVLAKARDARVIHIAAHGVADSEAPLESYIALSDGPWTAGTIQRACLSGTRLAILSACQSGLGGNHDGGIIGLGRAFIMAGSDNVAMSLWSVDDAGTRVLMDAFLGALASTPDAPPDEALRTAMLETRKARPSPFVWAAFAILGQARQ